MKIIDLPPVWLLGFILALALLAMVPYTSLGLTGGLFKILGAALIVTGLVLMGVAVATMISGRTTFMPNRVPEQLLKGGVFALTRNPIYLGDTLVLTGFALWWEVGLGLLLVPAFMWVLTHRFILPEEQAMNRKFGIFFENYAKTTRRWI